MKSRLVLFRTSIEALILTFVSVLCLSVSLAQVRTSPSYQLQSDSINVGGGSAGSASYVSESTIGEVATGLSESDSFALQAGFQQMQVAFISVTTPNDVVLTPELPGFTGGTSTASTTVTVVTDSPGGYQMSISASQSPAMQSPLDSIADYEPADTEPDFSFLVIPGIAQFGFSPSGPDRAPWFLSDGGVCGTGSSDIPETCWEGLSTTDRVIAVGSGANQPAGAQTTIFFQVGVGNGTNLLPGAYVATTTLTVMAL